MAWYYSSQSGQTGPITESELAALSRAGTINPGTLVWTEGQADWQPLSSVRPDLAGGFGSAPAVPVVGGMAVAGAGKDLAVQQLREGYAPGMTEVKYAGFWIRFGAKIIDGILLNIVMFPFKLMLMPSDEQLVESGLGAGGGLYMLIAMVLPFLYTGIMIGQKGATLGKMALGIKVVSDQYQPVSMGRAFGRAAAEWVSGLTIGIGYLIAAFDGQKRALHDHIASTRVIRTR